MTFNTPPPHWLRSEIAGGLISELPKAVQSLDKTDAPFRSSVSPNFKLSPVKGALLEQRRRGKPFRAEIFGDPRGR
jgi:hypothetical protein